MNYKALVLRYIVYIFVFGEFQDFSCQDLGLCSLDVWILYQLAFEM